MVVAALLHLYTYYGKQTQDFVDPAAQTRTLASLPAAAEAKTLFMTREEIINHAKKYSKSYGYSSSAWQPWFNAKPA